jgi:hypothetical protein
MSKTRATLTIDEDVLRAVRASEHPLDELHQGRQ